MPDDAIERAAVEIATRMVPGRFGDDGKRYMSLRQADDWTVAKRAALLAFASQQEPEGWRSISHELALAAGNLVVATDGIETLRDKRQLVLDRLNNLAAMLDAQPPTKEPTP
jgi:hypothetical protein